jgi:hypothetical protein
MHESSAKVLLSYGAELMAQLALDGIRSLELGLVAQLKSAPPRAA